MSNSNDTKNDTSISSIYKSLTPYNGRTILISKSNKEEGKYSPVAMNNISSMEKEYGGFYENLECLGKVIPVDKSKEEKGMKEPDGKISEFIHEDGTSRYEASASDSWTFTIDTFHLSIFDVSHPHRNSQWSTNSQ